MIKRMFWDPPLGARFLRGGSDFNHRPCPSKATGGLRRQISAQASPCPPPSEAPNPMAAHTFGFQSLCPVEATQSPGGLEVPINFYAFSGRVHGSHIVQCGNASNLT